MGLWKERAAIIQLIWPYIREYKLRLCILFILKCGQNIPELITPLLFKLFIDQVVGQKNIRFMVVVAVLFMLVYILETVLKVAHRYLDNHMFNQITEKLRTIMWSHYIHMDYQQYKKYDCSDLNKRLNDDIDMVKFFMIGEVFDYLTHTISILTAAVIIFILDWRIALLYYGFILGSVLLSGRFQNRISVLREEERVLGGEADRFIRQTVQSFKEVKANCLEHYQENSYEAILKQQYFNKKNRLHCMRKRNLILDIKNLYVDEFLLFLSGGIMHFIFMTTIGTVLSCIQYYHNMLNDIAMISEINLNLEWVKPSIYRALEVLSYSPTVDFKEKTEVWDWKFVYEIHHLGFRYENSTMQVIDDLNLKISSGDKLLIKGASGVGKTTLFLTMIQQLPFTEGEILFYGRSIGEVDRCSLYERIGVICQTPYFMNIRISEYLRIGSETASVEEMDEACEKACVKDFIEALPQKYDSMLGEAGENLSGGQRQKLALARLFLVNPKDVILDEAFSAIDGRDKGRILKALLNYFKDHAVICISHDPEIEGYFGKIVVLNSSEV